MKKPGSYRHTADVFLCRRAVPDFGGAISEQEQQVLDILPHLV